MTFDQSMQLLYLSLLGAVIGGYFLVANRRRMGRMVQMAAIWFFIFVGMVLVVGLWEDVSRTAMPRQDVILSDGGVVIEVPRERDGHYHMTLGVNGAPIRFIVDTGASDLVLSRDDAARAGIDLGALRYLGRAYTANGEVRTAQVRLDEVEVGGMVDRGVPAVVNEGDMRVSLLGMSYLQEFGRIEIADDTLRLVR
jgi:aspartyl protease family protein